MNQFDVIIIGAGAAGLMAASMLGQGGKKVLLLDKANKVGKKILMSGGGHCNFTNLHVSFENYLSHNPHFFKSALSRYTQWDFLELIKRYNIDYHEKKHGQLFCVGKARVICEMLLSECEKGSVTIKLKQEISKIQKLENQFVLKSNGQQFRAKRLIIASGGLSIPTMGASPFGYKVAEQFGHHIYPTRAGLVPFTLTEKDKALYSSLSGVSIACEVRCNETSFKEQLLFTHRGLSGPAILQISSYWQLGDTITLSLQPDLNLASLMKAARDENPNQQLNTVLSQSFPKSVLKVFLKESLLLKPLKQISEAAQKAFISRLQDWQIKPNGTEGYRTAEVTLGGVNCDEVSSKTFESKKESGLYFIGEVLDVCGHLGGFNFQWAWSSAHACASELLTLGS